MAAEGLERTLRRALAAFNDAGVEVMLGGSLAVWARGGPQTTHDLDFMVRPETAERALQALVAAGMRPERPPEGWLFKAYDDDGTLVDLIFHPRELELSDEVWERADRIEVLAIPIPVLSLEDAFATKILSLDEHSLDYSRLLLLARSVREQIDWEELEARTRHSPYAKAFFVLVSELGIAPAPAVGTPTAAAQEP